MKRKTESSQALSLKDLLYLAILLFLPTQLGKHFWPPFSTVVGIRIDYLSPTVYLTDLLLLALFILTCYGYVRTKKITSSLVSLSSSFLRKPFLVVGTAAVLVGAFLAPSPALSFYGLFRIFEVLFFAICTKQFLEVSFSRVKLFSLALLAAVFFESFLAIFQFLTQRSGGGILYLLGERSVVANAPGVALASLNGAIVLRPYGTFSHPNVLAGYLLISISIIGCLYLWQKPKERLHRVLVFILVLVTAVAIFLTLSRIVILLLFLLLISFAVLGMRRKRLRHPSFSLQWVLLPVAISVFFFSLLPLLVGRFFSADLFAESYLERVVLADVALQMVFSRPFYGVGLLQFIPSLPHYLPSVQFSLLQPVHNIFLLLLAETGIFGFAGAVALLVNGVKQQIRSGRRIFIIPFAYCMLLGLGDHYLLTQQQGRLLLGVVLGILFFNSGGFVHRLTKNTKKVDRTRRR